VRKPSGTLRLRSLPKDLRPLARTALAAGWRICGTRSHHSRWLSPCGCHVVICSSSPSDTDTIHIVRRLLRRAGLVV
jgi:hypothetical protein